MQSDKYLPALVALLNYYHICAYLQLSILEMRDEQTLLYQLCGDRGISQKKTRFLQMFAVCLRGCRGRLGAK